MRQADVGIHNNPSAGELTIDHLEIQESLRLSLIESFAEKKVVRIFPTAKQVDLYNSAISLTK